MPEREFQPAHEWRHTDRLDRHTDGRHVACECVACGVKQYATVRARKVRALEVSPPGADLAWCPVSGRDHRQHKGRAE